MNLIFTKDFYKAIGKNDLKICQAAVKAGLDVNAENDDDSMIFREMSLLCKAVEWGHYDICKLLLENGADPNVIIDGYQTPLFIAAYEGNFAICKLLIDHGASLDNPVLLLRAISSEKDQLEKVKLFVEKGADVNKPGHDDETPLIAAAAADELEIVRYLLGKGANIDDVDGLCNTALHRAVDGIPCSIELLQLLLDHGADINQENCEEINPLMLACNSGSCENALLLAEAGANFQNEQGDDFAWDHSPDHVREHLIKHGYF